MLLYSLIMKVHFSFTMKVILRTVKIYLGMKCFVVNEFYY